MRSIWKGHIRFLLVAIPVRIYNAIETAERIQFNQLHREDYGPIGYDKRCKKCDQVVTNDQITKGYQYEPDRYAIVEPEDIAKVKIKTTKAVDIIGFVDAEEIPATFYDSPYFAGPDGPVAEKPYALLREVMRQTGKIGIGKVVLRDREDLGVPPMPLTNARTSSPFSRKRKGWCCKSCITRTNSERLKTFRISKRHRSSTRMNLSSPLLSLNR